ncbi:NnrS family protein [Brevundimonas sp.]|uniref:NnrS family protein n=1 Tax=Brevundimonas sp. TaxID=1871086 RepID=UPI002FCBFAEB
MATTAESMRRYTGPALFSFGFRPFFLASALWAVLAVPIWIVSLTLGDGMVGATDGRAWHIHEMLFGYLGGVIAGFLLTAVPNWTGRLPVTGRGLAGLFALWVAGRAAGFAPASLSAPAAVVDAAFLIVFAAIVWREVLAAGNRRNLPVCLMVTALALANVAFHLRGFIPVGPGAERAAVAVIIGLVALIGGRVTPSFTQNWTLAHGVAARPAPFGRFDQITLALTTVALAAWVAAPAALLSGVVMTVAGVANAVRLLRWRGWLARREALVWILHAGYAWVAIGLVLLGLSAFFPAAVPFTAGIHAFTAGAMGVMTLAMMTRATRGHTGRPRVADRWTTLIYTTALAAAVVRVCAPFHAEWTQSLLGVSALLWSLAFLGFVLVYGPMMLRRSI